MKKWLIFGGGVVTGIVLAIVISWISSAIHSGDDDGMTWFEQPGDVIDVRAFKVFQVLGDDIALAYGQSRNYSSLQIFEGAVFLMTNEDGKYYYDDEIIEVPAGKEARQVGIFQYKTKSKMHKTVPIIQIMNK